MISRRALLTTTGALAGGLAASTLMGCSGAVNIPRPTASPTGAIKDQLDQVLTTIANGSTNFGVYVEDVRTGGTYSFNGDYASQSASMAKPMIVSMAMRKAGGPLTGDNATNATRAIENSDNDAASALWAFAGYQTYQTLADDLKMTHTHLDEAKSDQWSWTWTTPGDQVLLVRTLSTGGSSALTDDECAYLWNLMGQVEQDQTWGVGQPKSSSVNVHLKNGWVQFKSTDGLWAVNSMGAVEGDGRHYRLCVMTRVPDFDTGRAVTSEVGTWVFSILGSGTL
ncbi:serine hydrolase [Propionicimonas sp.]|uniref:serine hydrolase n=1 Tax=Propionicimonas sp. TaxID=1955623 RepID=UPI0039E70808